MVIWPVPDSYSKEIPQNGAPGSFWEDRGDRYHCGIDIYAPADSDVLAIQGGIVIDQGLFTSPDIYEYWNTTYYVLVKTNQNILIKYAELKDIFVHTGDFINAGDIIGKVGTVLNSSVISYSSPNYVRDYAIRGIHSMLHLEAYVAPISEVRPYQGGNYFGTVKPYSILDPSLFLNGYARRNGSNGNNGQ